MLASLRRTKPTAEQRALMPWGDWGGGSVSATGVNVTSDTATQLLTVYGCVALIADTIATLPIDVYQKVGGAPLEVPKPGWLVRPNADTTIIDFITQTLWSLLLDGNAYWAYGLSNAFVTNEVVVVDPSTVAIERDGRRLVYKVNGVPNARILHLRGIARPGQLKGLSPLEAARQSVGLGLAQQEFAARFFSNGASLSGFISTDADLSPEQAQQLQASWASAHSGLSNAHKPGVLDNGATWNTVTVSPQQAQFLESRNFTAAEIAGQLFLLDPTMLGIPLQSNSLTYANLEQRGIHLIQFSLLRWLIRLEEAFYRLLPRPHYVKFNVAALERADLKTRFEAYRIANPTAAWIGVDEIRQFEELGPTTEDLNPVVVPAAQDVQTNGHGVSP
jgi:HK97 family phage portal protein